MRVLAGWELGFVLGKEKRGPALISHIGISPAPAWPPRAHIMSDSSGKERAHLGDRHRGWSQHPAASASDSHHTGRASQEQG